VRCAWTFTLELTDIPQLPATVFGEIAARLAARPPETEIERGTRRFGFLILQTVLFCPFAFQTPSG